MFTFYSILLDTFINVFQKQYISQFRLFSKFFINEERLYNFIKNINIYVPYTLFTLHK